MQKTRICICCEREKEITRFTTKRRKEISQNALAARWGKNKESVVVQ